MKTGNLEKVVELIDDPEKKIRAINLLKEFTNSIYDEVKEILHGDIKHSVR